jgi:acetylornithine/N-succinyldiaminopimelate aminotransferase
MSKQFVMNTYARQPIAFLRGEGAWLFDDQGNRYLDAISGIAVCGLGHAHPSVTKAISEQADKLMHTSNLYTISLQEQLALKLCELSGMDNVFFCNSGAEANEAAIKIARLFGHQKNIAVPTVIVMEKSFHGRTLATLTATGSRKVQAGFEPLVNGFVRAPFNDVEAIHNIAKHNPNVVAVLVEPVQGEGGVHIPDAGYLKALRDICDKQDWLLMLDEVQTGNGRTGQYFAYQHENILPEVLTTAKGLGNGFPIGACLASGKASGVFHPGNHGSTFGGNPLACATALAVINTIEKENLLSRAQQLSARITKRLTSQIGNQDYVINIRSHGLMIGVELNQPCGDLVALARDHQLLINVTADSVIRLLPPLVLTDADADLLVNHLTTVITTHMNSTNKERHATIS